MLLRDEPTDSVPDPPTMVGELGSVRKHRTTGRVECLARWFVRASDRQLEAVLAPGDRGAAPTQPDSLVYRIGGQTQDAWAYDWVDAESVLGKCKTTYAPPTVILQHCERAAKRGWRHGLELRP